MPSLNEYLVQWFTPAGASSRTVLYANASNGTVDEQRAALNTFLSAYIPYCADSISYTVLQEGRVIEDTTGAHTGDWTSAIAHTGVGTQTSGPVPDVAQVLVRWRTDLFVGGRRLQGRTFLPGLGRANVEAGNVAPGVVTAVSAAAQAYAEGTGAHSIWHRPKTGGDGRNAPVQFGSCWTEMATQRRRRG